MREGGIQSLLAVIVDGLSDDGENGHQNAEEAVLENPGPDDLVEQRTGKGEKTS